ncbi:hypothetical protein C7382_11041 [Porphyromonas loveana]|uniref:Uncharacterized protein n=1 Tax=Porphyromonas loveana TaxID=1884669 RepID=A0A2U1FAI1_9PORP|nr:hypothetical protein C7382_11041 [Porphyromonas loveana]
MNIKKVNGILTVAFYILLVLTLVFFLLFKQTEQRWLYLVPGFLAIGVRLASYFMRSFKR